MRKVRVTKQAVMEAYDLVVPVGYCDLQYLLRFEQAVYYTAGVEGWHADLYVINVDYFDVVISTGYAPFGNLENVTYDMLSDYESKARGILCSTDYPMTIQNEMVSDLLKELCREFIEMHAFS